MKTASISGSPGIKTYILAQFADEISEYTGRETDLLSKEFHQMICPY
jgi:hypothetical protein